MSAKTAADVTGTSSRGFVGLNEAMEVSGGYDERHREADIEPECDWDEHFAPLPADEKVRLADIMIERWTRYRAAAAKV